MKEKSAGGVVFRRLSGCVEILLIEDRYGHWTLPKGKQEPGETDEETALREIWEETGIRARIVSPLHTVQYQYEHPDKGMVDKEVVYFLAEADSWRMTPLLAEIRGAFWLSPDEAWQRQQEGGYGNNLPVLEAAFRKLDIMKGDEP
jgi:diadenosine hexaphosphate hydrolase (ATP-forming)